MSVADSVAFGLPIGIAIGRIGCFFNGCCYGVVTTSFIGVRFPSLGDGLRHLPTQLFESAYSILIFLVLLWFNKKVKEKGSIFFAFTGLYGLLRFFNEFLRVNPKVYFGLSGSQIFSLLFIVASAYYFFVFQRKRKPRRG